MSKRDANFSLNSYLSGGNFKKLVTDAFLQFLGNLKFYSFWFQGNEIVLCLEK